MRKIGDKKAAIELSIGTIVILVLAMTMLVLGVVLVRNLMCSGILLTDQISKSTENEIKNLFGKTESGIICMGEAGQEIRLGDDGRRQIFCVINTDENAQYDIKIKNVESLSGVPTATVQSWIVNQGWTGNVEPGSTTQVILVLNVPQKVSDTGLKITAEAKNLATGNIATHTMFIDIKHVGSVTATVC